MGLLIGVKTGVWFPGVLLGRVPDWAGLAPSCRALSVFVVRAKVCGRLPGSWMGMAPLVGPLLDGAGAGLCLVCSQDHIL